MMVWRLTSLVLCFGFGFGVMSAKAADGNVSDLVNRDVLRVCSDPANIPFSNDKAEGFENKIAGIIADEMKIPVSYTWFPQATGFVRRTLFAKRCDLIIGFAQGDEFVLNTNHYYVSTYAIVYKKDAGFDGLDTVGDPRLKGKRVGLIAGTPPGTILAREGLMAMAKPYPLTVDRRYDSPNERMIKDIKNGEIAAGIMWGPIAGYFTKKLGDGELVVVPLLKEGRKPRMTYRITMGVRQSDKAWKRELNDILLKRRADIDAVLLEYGVPLVDEDNNVFVKPRG